MGFIDVFVLLLGISGASIFILSTMDLQFNTISKSALSTSPYVDTFYLAIIRACLGTVVWSSALYIFLDREGLSLPLKTPDGTEKIIHQKHATRFTYVDSK